MANTRCGTVALIGRPNVGKSTLMNALLGSHLSIVTHKPQTTRQRILGIKTTAENQLIYVDTPGLHKKTKRGLNKYMNRTASAAIAGVDVVVLMVEALRWTDDDQWALSQLAEFDGPVILCVNKTDLVSDGDKLYPFVEQLQQKHSFHTTVAISAGKAFQLDVLEQKIAELLPQAPFMYPAEQTSDRDQQFWAREIIREQLMTHLHQELPYALYVSFDLWEREDKLQRIAATIWVETAGQKAIVIGKGGSQLKRIGSAARKHMETHWGCKVFLQLWVKVDSGWPDEKDHAAR